MTDVFKVAEVLLEYAVEKYPSDIAVIAYYGSYARGTAHEKSDLDIFYIPATEKGYQAAFQFVLDGIGYDFWPISWERAWRIASFEEPLTAVIADARVLYSRNEDDLRRFNDLRERIKTFCNPENRGVMVKKARANFRAAYLHLYNLHHCQGNLSALRVELYKLLTVVLQSLALFNQTYYHRGWGDNKGEIGKLERKPPELEKTLDRVLRASDSKNIRSMADKLVKGVGKLLLVGQESPGGDESFPGVFSGFYEEGRSLLNKITAACERGDYQTAFFAAVGMQEELSKLLARVETGLDYSRDNCYQDYRESYQHYNLPDLVGLLEDGRLEPLQLAVRDLDSKLKGLFSKKGLS